MGVVNGYVEKLALAEAGGFDEGMLKSFGMWIMNSKEELGETVLDVNAKEGYFTCFMASLNADKQFTGVAGSAKELEKAIEVKNKLGLTNVEFVEDYFGLEDRQFATLVMPMAFAEYVPFDRMTLRFRPFNEQLKGYAKIYDEYIGAVTAYAAEGANIIAAEKVDMGTELYGVLDDFIYYGFKFRADATEKLECIDDVKKEKLVLVSMSFTWGEETSEELFVDWAKLALGNKNQMSDCMADYILFTTGGKLIEGYSAFDKSGNQAALCGIYEVKDDPASFLMYQATIPEKNIRRFPMTRKLELVKTLSRDKEIAKKSGFQIMDFGVNNKL